MWRLIMTIYHFPAADRFVNRAEELAAMDAWWAGDDNNALNLYGRRRVGKSWLIRKFADSKPAVILVAEHLSTGAQLARLASQLGEALGLVPMVEDVPALFRLIYKLGEKEKVLVVLDEFPYLLPRSASERAATLTGIQAVMEEGRDSSQTKLILCGSHVGQMQALQSESSALRGRLSSLMLAPMSFAQGAELIEDTAPAARIERYSATGGTARYLSELGSGGSLRDRVCERLLNPHGALFNDPREVLEQELEQSAIYLSILREVSTGPKAVGEIGSAIGVKSSGLMRQLDTLIAMQVIERRRPINAGPSSRSTRYAIGDPFLSFWFRFVFPYQEDLASGADPGSLYDLEIAPALAEHVAPIFERLCRVWVRSRRGDSVSRVGAWWGASAPSVKSRERSREEIDIVGMARGKVAIVGECKWTNRPVGVSLLADLENFKIPALRHDGLRFVSDPEILIFSRSGFTERLRAVAERRRLHLVSVHEI